MPAGKYHEKPLNMKQLNLIRLVSEGASIGEAAKEVGMSATTASKTMRRPDTQKMFLEFANNVMREAAGKAAKRLVQQLDSDNEWVVQQAAGRILQYLQTIENGQNASITVNFSTNMPRPGMPEKIADASEAVIPAEGQVN